MIKLSIILGMLVIAEKITADEADMLMEKLGQEEIPSDWRGFVKQLEDNLSRKLI